MKCGYRRPGYADERLSSVARMHFNYDVQIPFDQLIAKWGLVKESLIRLEITEWMDEMEIEQNL